MTAMNVLLESLAQNDWLGISYRTTRTNGNEARKRVQTARAKAPFLQDVSCVRPGKKLIFPKNHDMDSLGLNIKLDNILYIKP